MGTISCVGYKDSSGRIIAVGCSSDGYLSHNGVFIDAFYADRDKAKFLVSNGWISSISENPLPLIDVPDKEDLKVMSLGFCNYTVFSRYINPYLKIESYTYEFESDFENDKRFEFSEYFYLFDETDDKWYVLKKDKRFELHKLLNDKRYFYEYYLLTDDALNRKNNYECEQELLEDIGEKEWETINYVKQNVSKLKLPVSIAYLCSMWLSVKVRTENLVVNYSETDRCYNLVVESRKNNEVEKVVMVSENINDLTFQVCKKYDINIYDRPVY